MSLLKRIESARPGAGGTGAPTAPGTGSPNVPAPTGAPPSGAPPTGARLMGSSPTRESFRDVKFRIQNRVIQDLDP